MDNASVNENNFFAVLNFHSDNILPPAISAELAVETLVGYLSKVWMSPSKKRKVAAIALLPPEKAVEAFIDLFLGENWYTDMPLSNDQCNTVVVDQILSNESSRYRKDKAKAERRAKT